MCIYVEPGLWMYVPATDKDPILGESLCRMASIPDGTTINGQCLAPTNDIPGPPQFQPVDITPFSIGNTRLPQYLSQFIANGTMTQAMLTNPNSVLEVEIVGWKITSTTVFTVSTSPAAPELGGSTVNIAFLQGGISATGGAQAGPNANAEEMSATFWVETLEHKLTLPAFKSGQAPLKITPEAPHPGGLVPTFLVNPSREIIAPETITVHSTQIQYSKTVSLNFAGLTGPHVSVATLIPKKVVKVPVEVFN